MENIGLSEVSYDGTMKERGVCQIIVIQAEMKGYLANEHLPGHITTLLDTAAWN